MLTIKRRLVSYQSYKDIKIHFIYLTRASGRARKQHICSVVD